MFGSTVDDAVAASFLSQGSSQVAQAKEATSMQAEDDDVDFDDL
jgi:hypothetical protein